MAAAAGWNRRDEQIAKIYGRYVTALKESNALDFDDLLLQDRRAVRDSRERVRTKYAEQFRFVMVDEYQDTNRPQYLLIRRLAEVAPQPVRGRRSRSVDLQVARRRSPEHPRLRAGLPRSDDRQARTQLPVDADHSRRRIGRHQPEPEPQGQAPLDRPEGRRPDRLLPRRRRARGSRLHHAHGARRPGRRRRRDGRGALSDQRAVADDRRRADARGARLQDRRRRPLLRAQGDQGRARLHAAGHQPARRREPAAGDQRAGARHRQGGHGRARELRAGRRPRRRRRLPAAGGRTAAGAGRQLALGAPGPRPRGARVQRPGRRVADGVPRSDRQPDRHRAAGFRLDRHRQDARSERLPAGSARGPHRGRAKARIENLAELVSAAREYESREPEPIARPGSSIACRCSPTSTRRRARATPASG